MNILTTVQWFGPTQMQFISVSSCCCQKPCLLCRCVLMICWSLELRIVLGRQVHLIIMIWLHQACYSWYFVHGFRELCEEYTKTIGSCFVLFFHNLFVVVVFIILSFVLSSLLLFLSSSSPLHHLSHHDF